MKKIFALVAVAMVSATAFVSCTKSASVEALKELAAAEKVDTTKLLAMVDELKKDTTLTEADLCTIDSIAQIYGTCAEEVQPEEETVVEDETIVAEEGEAATEEAATEETATEEAAPAEDAQ